MHRALLQTAMRTDNIRVCWGLSRSDPPAAVQLCTVTSAMIAHHCCRDIVIRYAPGTAAINILPPQCRATIDCAGHAMGLYAPGGSFELGAASQATFRNCYWSNYAPGQAARTANGSKFHDQTENAPALTPYRPDDTTARIAILDSYLEQPCNVRDNP
jgi:hypothetical protein